MQIDVFTKEDLPLVPLLQPEGWYDITPNITFYTQKTFCALLKVAIGDEIAGMGAVIFHEKVAWLGHIIVRPPFRGQGLGTRITEALLEKARQEGAESIYLIATEMGEPVYRKLGFQEETEYIFFKDFEENTPVLPPCVLPFSPADAQAVAELDRQITGEDRWAHLSDYLPDALLYWAGERLIGAYLPTFGDGLILAYEAEAGETFLRLHLSRGKLLCFPAENKTALQFMEKNGYQSFRRAKRMFVGKPLAWQPQCLYNRVAGNIG